MLFLNRFPDYIFYQQPREVIDFKDYHTVDTFENITDKTTIELFDVYEDITLLWSGGLDSSCVLCSFLKHNKKFRLLTTEYSEIEYYDLFHKLKDNTNIEFITISSKNFLSYIYKLDTILITGDLGDQVFMSPLVLGNEDIRNLPYRMVIPDEIIIKNESYVNKILANNINANVSNYLWSLDFIYKWNMVRDRLKTRIGKNNVIPFFDNFEFEKYSVTNQVKNSKYENILYKKDMRDYIFNVINDFEYSYTKEKMGSQKTFLKKNWKDDFY